MQQIVPALTREPQKPIAVRTLPPHVLTIPDPSQAEGLLTNTRINACLWKRPRTELTPSVTEALGAYFLETNKSIDFRFRSAETTEEFRFAVMRSLVESGFSAIFPKHTQELVSEMQTFFALTSRMCNPATIEASLTTTFRTVAHPHIDYEKIVAIATYVGPGTEYFGNDQVQLSYRRPVTLPAQIVAFTASNDDVLIFRGDYPLPRTGEFCNGLVHRSPLDKTQRLVFSVFGFFK